MDWRDCVERYDSPTTVMYLDPPYMGNGANYKFNMRGEDDHRSIAEQLGRMKGFWILSSYNTTEIRELFYGYAVTPIQSSSGMRTSKSEREAGRYRTINQEILITNFTPPMSETPVTRPGSEINEDTESGRQSDMFPGGSMIRESSEHYSP